MIGGEYSPDPPWSKEAEIWWLERNQWPSPSQPSSQRSQTTLGDYIRDSEFEPVRNISDIDDASPSHDSNRKRMTRAESASQE